MKRLSEMKKGEEGIISSVNGDTRYIGRITSIGITPGCKVKIIKNDKNRPIIVFSRDTMITSELNMSVEQVQRDIEFLERNGVIKRVNTSICGSKNCSGCASKDGQKTCPGCMPEGGFKNMGVMWEIT